MVERYFTRPLPLACHSGRKKSLRGRDASSCDIIVRADPFAPLVDCVPKFNSVFGQRAVNGKRCKSVVCKR